jgi:hypothetical protein
MLYGSTIRRLGIIMGDKASMQDTASTYERKIAFETNLLAALSLNFTALFVNRSISEILDCFPGSLFHAKFKFSLLRCLDRATRIAPDTRGTVKSLALLRPALVLPAITDGIHGHGLSRLRLLLQSCLSRSKSRAETAWAFDAKLSTTFLQWLSAFFRINAISGLNC